MKRHPPAMGNHGAQIIGPIQGFSLILGIFRRNMLNWEDKIRDSFGSGQTMCNWLAFLVCLHFGCPVCES